MVSQTLFKYRINLSKKDLDFGGVELGAEMKSKESSIENIENGCVTTIKVTLN